MLKKINIGVLGCSSIANRSVIPSIVRSESFKLVAVASRQQKKGEDFANRFNCNYCSYNELLRRSDIEAVYVSLPVSLHYEWGIKVINSGKHLLLEKTFTDSYDKAEEIITLADDRNLIAMEALMYLYHPLFNKVKSLVQGGSIGEPRQIEASFGFPDLPPNDIRHNKNLGGGGILDALIYPLSFSLNMKKEPYEKISYNIISHEKYDIDARGFLKIDWHDCSAFINYGFGFVYRNNVSVWGSEGYLSVDRVFTPLPDFRGEILIRGKNGDEKVEVPNANHFDLMLDDFSNKINGVHSPSINEKDDILKRMKIISEIYNHSSQKTNQAIKDVAISVIIPAYFAEKSIENTVNEIVSTLNRNFLFEIIIVNDGSQDRTFEVIKRMAESSHYIKAINLMRNFGQHNAIMAGMHEASGDFIVLLDDDGQHDPAYISQMLNKCNEGYDVVYVKYDKKVYGFFKKLGSKLNDLMAVWLLGKPSNLYLSSFKMLTRKVKNLILQYAGPFPYIDGTILSLTKNITSIPAKHRSSVKPFSTYSLSKLVSLWLNMFINFSVKPLRIIFFLGIFLGLVSIIMGIVYFMIKFINPNFAPPGWTMLLILLIFFGSIQIICLGFLGEYIGRILFNINNQPQFIIREKINKDE